MRYAKGDVSNQSRVPADVALHRFRCPACRAEFNRDKVWRHCAFHPGTRTFFHRNNKCATLSRLRWLLRQNGVPMFHPEHEGMYTCYSMGILDEDGESGGRLQGVWLKGSEKTTLMQVIRGDEALPLHYDTAARILREFRLENIEDVRKLSADFTR